MWVPLLSFYVPAKSSPSYVCEELGACARSAPSAVILSLNRYGYVYVFIWLNEFKETI